MNLKNIKKKAGDVTKRTTEALSDTFDAAGNVTKRATEGVSDTFGAVKEANVTKKATGALSDTFDTVKDGQIVKTAKGALPGTIDTLKGENGRKAQVYGWTTVATVAGGSIFAGVAAAPLMAVGIAADVVTGAISTHIAVKMDETKKAHEAEVKALEEKLKAYEKKQGPKPPTP